MMRRFVILAVLWLAAPLAARDIYVVSERDPALTPQEIAAHLESSGIPRGVLHSVSPPGTTNASWRRITFEYRGKGGAKVHLYRMMRPPYLTAVTPDVRATLEKGQASFGFIGMVPDSGPVIRIKALIAGLIAQRGGGLVYDSKLAQALPVAVWEQQIRGEDFEFPMAVDRAVLRCYSIPASPVETVAFRWIPTSIGAVAFDERAVIGTVTPANLPTGSIEAGRFTTAGLAFRVFDMEKEWGAGKPSPIASRYVLLSYERGGLALPADRLHGPIEVLDLHVQLVPPGAAAGSLPSLIVESGETIPAGGPSAFIWLGAGSGKDTARVPLIDIARSSLRGPYDRRENAIRSLWRIPGPDAVEQLKDIARAGTGEHLRTLALKGLAGREDGFAALVDLARRGRGREAPESVQVLAGLKRADTPRVLLETAMLEDSNVEARREALMRLRTMVRPEHVPMLRNLLASPSALVRVLAADLILRVGPSTEARALLVEELRNASVELDVIVPLLLRHRVTEAAPLLASHLATAPAPIRPRIENALSVLSPAQIPPVPPARGPAAAPVTPAVPTPDATGATHGAAAAPELSTTAVVLSPRARKLASAVGAPITVSAPAAAALPPLAVVQALAQHGLPVALGGFQAGPSAAPAEWDSLSLKLISGGGNVASVTQSAVPSASGGAARMAYAVTCLAPADPRALDAAGWLAFVLAEKTGGAIADASGHIWQPASWRAEFLE